MAEEKKFDQKKFIVLLNQKGANKPCARCGKQNFTLIDGYSYFPVNEKLGTILGGPTIPALLVACNNCGAVVPHAIGVFENLNNQENEEKPTI